MPDFLTLSKGLFDRLSSPGGRAKEQSLIFLNAPAGAVAEAFRLPQNSLLGRVGGT